MKEVRFVGRALDELREFPTNARHDTGFELDRVQRGLDPNDWKPLPTVGPGVREIRVKTAEGIFGKARLRAAREDAERRKGAQP